MVLSSLSLLSTIGDQSSGLRNGVHRISNWIRAETLHVMALGEELGFSDEPFECGDTGE
jgi:hypothetical protein